MSWDEKLFGTLYKRLFGRGRSRLAVERASHGVLLEPERARIRILASAMAGAIVDVQAAEAEGGTAEALLLLPETFVLASDRAINEKALLFRVLFGALSIRLGMCVPKGWDGPMERALATTLSVPATVDALEEAMPGARGLRDSLEVAAIASRPDLRKLDSPSAALEVLVQARLGRPWGDFAALADARAIAWARAAFEERPGGPEALGEAVGRFADFVRGGSSTPVPLWGRLSNARRPAPAPAAGAAPNESTATTERRGKPREGARRIELPGPQDEENPLVHSFEKVHTVEEHQGGNRKADGSDELDEHFDALEDANVREVVRSNERVKSLLRADVTFDDVVGDVPDGVAGDGIPYDEWDSKLGAYRRDWCTVQVSTGVSFSDARRAFEMLHDLRRRERRSIERLRASFEAIALQRRWRTGQRDGIDVDVDALVDRLAALRSGHTGTDRLYVSRRRCEQDVEVMLLVDCSLSTDGWIRGRRVLAVAKETVVLLVDGFEHVGVPISVAGFHSNTRRDCRFTTMKSFDEAATAGYRRLAAVEPVGYTRIGPALRHATSILRDSPARKKLLVLISDGKPTDYDRYEGRHGIGDVRKAAREAALSGVETFCLAIDAQSRAHLSEMFGPNGYETVLSSGDLVASMTRVYADLMR